MSSQERELTPFDELELMDLHVGLASLDEEQTMFDPDTAPRTPRQSNEPIRDTRTEERIDIMLDTPAVDEIANFDLTEKDLLDADL